MLEEAKIPRIFCIYDKRMFTELHPIVKNDHGGRNDKGENNSKNEKYIQFEQNKQFIH